MSTMGPATRELTELLAAYTDAPAAERPALAARINDRFATEQTILIGDMASFTRRVDEEGIVHFLSLIFRMRAICTRIIEESRGYLFKIDADNIFVSFQEPGDGLTAACRLQQALQSYNAARPPVDHISLGIGLAHGPVLAIDGEDVWGQAINYAAKLGEDISQDGMVLAHESLLPWLEARGLRRQAREVFISGLPLRYFEVEWT